MKTSSGLSISPLHFTDDGRCYVTVRIKWLSWFGVKTIARAVWGLLSAKDDE